MPILEWFKNENESLPLLPSCHLFALYLILVYMGQSIIQLSLNETVNETVPNVSEDKTKLSPYLQNRARLTEALKRRL